MTKLKSLSTPLQKFIAAQKVFFVATAMREGLINLSPKGMDSFRIINPNRIVWLNLTGSGNETAIHLTESNRMTIMFCAFEGSPLILRLYGSATAYHETDAEFENYLGHFPALAGVRQIIEMDIEMVQTSCGYGVPLMDFMAERTKLIEWAEDKGEAGLKAYQKEKNSVSLDGVESKVFG